MDDAILITELNDFIFCPASIYFHKLYGSMDKLMYQSADQLNGTAAHEAVDEAKYSTKRDISMEKVYLPIEAENGYDFN